MVSLASAEPFNPAEALFGYFAYRSTTDQTSEADWDRFSRLIDGFASAASDAQASGLEEREWPQFHDMERFRREGVPGSRWSKATLANLTMVWKQVSDTQPNATIDEIKNFHNFQVTNNKETYFPPGIGSYTTFVILIADDECVKETLAYLDYPNKPAGNDVDYWTPGMPMPSFFLVESQWDMNDEERDVGTSGEYPGCFRISTLELTPFWAKIMHGNYSPSDLQHEMIVHDMEWWMRN